MSDLREKGKSVTSPSRKDVEIFTIDRAVTIIFSSVIFIVAIISIVKISSWIHGYLDFPENSGSPMFNYSWTDPDKGPMIWYFEIYNDAHHYYVEYLDAFKNWWNPYARYDHESPLDYYMYGPMFIYGLYFTYLLMNISYPGASESFLVNSAVKWTAINFECLSAVLIYLIIVNFSSLGKTKVKKHVIGVVGAFAYVFMPMNLMYVDAYSLNIPQMTFFTLLTLLFFMKERYKLSSISLSVAWLTKQIPLFILIPLFSFIWKKYDLKKAFKEFLNPFLLTFLIFSIPWIFLSPLLYIGRILGAGRPLYFGVNLTDTGRGVTFTHTFLYAGAEGLATFYYWINIPMIPFLLTYLFGLFVGHFNAKTINSNDSYFIYYITWLFVIIHTFISRGIFKYYDVFLNPFLILTTVLLINNLIEKCKDHFKNSNDEKFWKKFVIPNLWISLEVILILALIAAMYSFNWGIMITIRFLHPVFLFGLLLILSPTIQNTFYKGVFQKENYKLLGQDFKDFFGYIKKSAINIFLKMRNFFQNIRQLFNKK